MSPFTIHKKCREVALEIVNLCICTYNILQLSDDHYDFDDDNIICQIEFIEVFNYQ